MAARSTSSIPRMSKRFIAVPLAPPRTSMWQSPPRKRQWLARGRRRLAETAPSFFVPSARRSKCRSKRSPGYFLEPTIFADVAPAARIWREEIFGPVLAVTTFNTEDEAVALANESEFGLAAAVMSAD